MLNKILLALGVIVIVSALGGNALTCQYCLGTSAQMCNSSNVITCGQNSTYCFTATYTDSNGAVAVIRGCDDDPRTGGEKFCPDADATCAKKTKADNLKACAGACCKKDKCNNYTPSSSATGIVVAKITLILMVIAGGFAA